MTTSDVWGAAAAATYDEDAAEQFAPTILNPTLDVLARLADGGPVLELAVGTGRVAIALAGRGIPVTGIELSEAMVAQLRLKPGGQDLRVVTGDMATTVVPGAGEFALVFLVWNTLGNLRTQAEQVQCFRNAAAHLHPGGRFVVELWIPPIQRLTPGHDALAMTLDDEHLVFDTYDVVTQQCSSHHYRTESDGTVRRSVGHFRYVWPTECDLMAQLAGLEPESRWADWHAEPYVATSENHVSVWRKPVTAALRGVRRVADKYHYVNTQQTCCPTCISATALSHSPPGTAEEVPSPERSPPDPPRAARICQASDDQRSRCSTEVSTNRRVTDAGLDRHVRHQPSRSSQLVESDALSV